METAQAEKPKQEKTSEVLSNIEATKPLLFTMGEQLLATEKDRWNIIIGDDAGGRLPARFVHDLFKQDGRDVETFFVASSGVYRKANGPEPYKEYFKYLEEQLGEPLRPLVVTESVNSGSTVDFIRECLEDYSAQPPEFAAVAVTEASRDKVDFIGGMDDEAIENVHEAYESPPAKLSLGRQAIKILWGYTPERAKKIVKSKTSTHINPPTMNAVVGIYVDPESPKPLAQRHSERDGQKSTDAYHFIDELAAEAYERHLEKRVAPAA